MDGDAERGWRRVGEMSKIWMGGQHIYSILISGLFTCYALSMNDLGFMLLEK